MIDIKQLAVSHTTLDMQSGHTCNDSQVLAREYLWILKENESLKHEFKMLQDGGVGLKEENWMMKEKLCETLNYLHFRTDDLVGDDIVGDKRHTRRFEELTSSIESLFKLTPHTDQLAKQRAADLAVIEAAKKLCFPLRFEPDEGTWSGSLECLESKLHERDKLYSFTCHKCNKQDHRADQHVCEE